MSFIKKSADITPVIDTVFTVVSAATKAKQEHGIEKVCDATIGSLYGEDGQIVALKSVYDNYDTIPSRMKAKYAGGFKGNENYREAMAKWVLRDNVQLPHSVIATPGGTGAVNLTIDLMLETGQTLVIPQVAWGSYAVMANNKGLQVEKYELFEEDHFHLNSFKEVCSKVIKQQHKLVVVINDPCHNPTGYSMTRQEWQAVIDYLNELSAEGEVVVLNDIAYLDYSFQRERARDYMQVFNTINNKVLVVVAFSCSKALTSYGLRCGAAIILGKEKEAVQVCEDCYAKAARAIWSNVNNSAMENFVGVTQNRYEEYMAEKEGYIQLLEKRSSIVLQEAKECGLALYPFTEGFFVTVKLPDNQTRDKYHELLCKNLIFTVKVNLGVRVGICSLSIEKCYGLAKRLKDILSEVES
ncbi:MAG: aminotransferase class I/II-fold pyridoxal phosphate-dependent enzyme [Erysipelotrichales bacterium]|nr:aminotransferase class I/II-fold pyridoxal phosphate-dependent enzyme [Erysipelotrichales bacterium]